MENINTKIGAQNPEQALFINYQAKTMNKN